MSWIHEVKIPIAASRLLMENSENKTTDFLIDKLEDELHKIDDYVEQALYYSRIDSFSKDYFISEVNTNQLIKKKCKKNTPSYLLIKGFIWKWMTQNSLSKVIKSGLCSLLINCWQML